MEYLLNDLKVALHAQLAEHKPVGLSTMRQAPIMDWMGNNLSDVQRAAVIDAAWSECGRRLRAKKEARNAKR